MYFSYSCNTENITLKMKEKPSFRKLSNLPKNTMPLFCLVSLYTSLLSSLIYISLISNDAKGEKSFVYLSNYVNCASQLTTDQIKS